MSAVDLCAPGFTEVADTLGGIACIAPPLVASVRSPLDLANWTLPVVELLMIVGAVASLVHALRRWRRHGDPTNLALWFATVVYVLLLEPPLYFPDRFGLQDQVGLIFVHNLFSVQFLYDRLPLYIVALYPALTYLAYALVQRTGVLERRLAAGRGGVRGARLPRVLRDLRPPRPAAAVVGLEPGRAVERRRGSRRCR